MLLTRVVKITHGGSVYAQRRRRQGARRSVCSFLLCVSGEMSSSLLQCTSHVGLISLMQELLHASDRGTRPGPQFSPAVQACYEPSQLIQGRETGSPPHLWRAARSERPGLRQTRSYVLKATHLSRKYVLNKHT